MAILRKEVTGHLLEDDLSKLLDEYDVAAHGRNEVVEARLAELESEQAALRRVQATVEAARVN